MRRGRIFIYLALIVVLGVAAFFLLSKNLGKNPTSSSNAENTPGVVATPIPIDRIDVVVSSQDIPRGLPITEDHLGKRTIPLDMYDSGMFKYPDELDKVVGRIPVSTIKQNHIILTGDLVDKATLFEGRSEALLIRQKKWPFLSRSPAFPAPRMRLWPAIM